MEELGRFHEYIRAQVEQEMSLLLQDAPETMTGKKLRSLLVALVNQGLGGRLSNAIAAGAWIELIHEGTLMQDDWLDADVLRRGAPAFYLRHGSKAAVLQGERYLTRAFAASAKASQEAANEVAEALDAVLSGVLMEDMSAILKQLLRGKPHKEWYFPLIGKKTGTLFASAAKLGTLETPIETDVREALSYFGYQVGMAFQMADDAYDLVRFVPTDDFAVVMSILPLLIHYHPKMVQQGLTSVFQGDGQGFAFVTDLRGPLLVQLKKDIVALLRRANAAIAPLSLQEPYGLWLRYYPRYVVQQMLGSQGGDVANILAEVL